MTEMHRRQGSADHSPTAMDCEQCEQAAAELALDVLCGRERAGALAHLERCTSCQDSVAALTATVSHLVQLVPEAQPPDGFDRRVLAAVTLAEQAPPGPAPTPAQPAPPGPTATPAQPAPTRSHATPAQSAPPGATAPGRTAAGPTAAPRRTRVPLAAALVATATVLACGGWAWGLAGHQLQPPDGLGSVPMEQPAANVVEAPLISRDRPIGEAYIHADNPSWIFVSITDGRSADVPAPPANTTVKCVLLRQDGPAVQLGTFALRDGRADWGAHTEVNSRTLAGAQLTTERGHVLASAHFVPPQRHGGTPHEGSSDRNRPDQSDQSDQPNRPGADQEKDKGDQHVRTRASIQPIRGTIRTAT